MKTDFNKTIIEGRICSDVNFVTMGEKKIANYSIATNKVVKKDGEYVEEASFFNCSGFTTEKLAKFLTKGQHVLIEGNLKQDRWEKDGKKFQAVKIQVLSIKLLSLNSSDNKISEQVNNEAEMQFAEQEEINFDNENYFG